MKPWGFLVLGLVALIAVTGCDDVKPIQEMTIPASTLDTAAKGDDDAATSACFTPCGLATMGTQCLYNDPDELFVGYSSNYDAGTQPCPCWEWVACTWRGFVYFDLTSLTGKGIVGAELRFNESSNFQGGGLATNETECIASLNIANAPYNGWNTPMDVMFSGPDTGDNVSWLVRDWVDGTKPNHGLVFRGKNESLPGKQNVECQAVLTNLELFVLYTNP